MSAKKFAHPTVLPEGFLYQPDFLSESEAAKLLRTVEPLQFGAYDFRQRRAASLWAVQDPGPSELGSSQNTGSKAADGVRSL